MRPWGRAVRLLAPGILLLAAGTQAEAPAGDEFSTGKALFDGEIELRGRIGTHLVDLPPTVVRCANCHAVSDGPEVPRSLAPRLTHDLLLRPRPRRGGPTSVYDRDEFCTLLRRGIDPAMVVISVEMPRYAIDDVNCRALWRYVIANRPADDSR
jgi:hypothetical protein